MLQLYDADYVQLGNVKIINIQNKYDDSIVALASVYIMVCMSVGKSPLAKVTINLTVPLAGTLLTSRKFKLSFMIILCHFGCVIPNISHQLRRVIPNIHVTLDHFPVNWTFLVILDSVTKDHVFY